MTRNRMGSFYLGIGLAVASLGACSQGLNVRTPSPVQTKNCDPGTVGQAVQRGWTWLDITVGISTIDDVILKFGQPTRISPWPGGAEATLACTYYYALPTEDFPVFWTSGGKVIAIQFTNSNGKFQNNNLPTGLKAGEMLYGSPTIVGWSSIYEAGYRSVVWSDRGVQAEVLVSVSQTILQLLYFRQMSAAEFSNSPFAGLALMAKPTWKSDVIDTLPQDPFH